MATLPPSESQLGIDEERSLLSQETLARENIESLPTHSPQEDLEDGGFKHMISASRTAWQRFNGHGRRPVGFFKSLKAVVLSSCAFIPLQWPFLGLTPDPRHKLHGDLNSVCLAFPLPTMGRDDNLLVYVLTTLGIGICCSFTDDRCLWASVLPRYHPFGKTLRMVWRADGAIPRIDLGRSAHNQPEQYRRSHSCHHSLAEVRVSGLTRIPRPPSHHCP